MVLGSDRFLVWHTKKQSTRTCLSRLEVEAPRDVSRSSHHLVKPCIPRDYDGEFPILGSFGLITLQATLSNGVYHHWSSAWSHRTPILQRAWNMYRAHHTVLKKWSFYPELVQDTSSQPHFFCIRVLFVSLIFHHPSRSATCKPRSSPPPCHPGPYQLRTSLPRCVPCLAPFQPHDLSDPGRPRAKVNHQWATWKPETWNGLILKLGPKDG